MRVLITVRDQSSVPGSAGVPGGQIGMIQLARALRRRGHDVRLFVAGRRMAYFDGLDDVPTTYFGWPSWREPLTRAAPRALRSRVERRRREAWVDALTRDPAWASADVVHVQGLQDAEALLARAPGPLVVTHWGRVNRWRPSSPGTDGDDTARRRRVVDGGRVVAIGEAQADELTAVGLPPAAVIPPGIDLDHFTPGERDAARRMTGLDPAEAVVLFVGRLADDKNVVSLLRAFALPSRHSRPQRLVVVGDGPRRADLHRVAAELGIAGTTTFVPFVPHNDLPAYYRAGDVTVVPSDRLETFCMVALEAIACGAAVVVTDHAPEIIRQFPDVGTVRPYDLAAMRDRIDDALDRPREPGEGADRMAGHGWFTVADRYVDLYETARRHPV